MKKADVILILVVGVICAALFFWRFSFRDEGASVRIEVNGEEYGTYSLDKDQKIEINDSNVLMIENGAAYMTEANCPDKLCINQGKISSDGEMIVCLPNRVFVQIEGSEDGSGIVDAVAG